MFGDWGWISARTDDQYEKYGKWLDSIERKKLCIIEIGAGTAVPTVRHESETILRQYENSSLIRINPRESFIPKNCK